MFHRTPAILLFVTGIAAAASAQQPPVSLQFRNGRVSLSAQNVPVRQILAEWARLGGTRIIDADRVSGGPVTLELTDIPEQQALDIVLRGVAGYMLAPRASTSTGSSVFDRILILPTSNAPRPLAVAPTPFGAPGGRAGTPMPFAPSRPGLTVEANPVTAPIEDDADGDADVEDAGVAVGPAVRTPGPAVLAPRPFPTPGNPAGAIPPMIQFPSEQDTDTPAEAKPTTSVGNPFGVPAGSSNVPGVIAPVPQQPSTPR